MWLASVCRSPFLRGLVGLWLILAPACAARQPVVTKIVNGKVLVTRQVSPRAYEHVARALLFEEEERYEDAVAELERAVGEDPRAPEVWARLAENLLALDRADDARKAIDASLAIDTTVDGLMAEAHLLLHRGDARAAAEALTRALPLTDFGHGAEEAERVYLERADLQLMALDLPGARDTLGALLEGLPASQPGLYRQAALDWATGARDSARRLYRRLVEIEPDHLEARLLLARLDTADGHLQEARSAYVETLARAEGDLGVAAAYALFLRTHGFSEDAAALAESLRVSVDDPSTLYARMELERAAGRLEQALEMADAALSTQPPNDARGRALFAKGVVLEAARQPLEAMRSFEAIAEDAPTFAEGRLRAVALLREQGDVPAAQALLSTVSDDALDPDMQREVVVAQALLAASASQLARARQILADVPPELRSDVRLQLAAATLEDKYGDKARALALAEEVLVKDPSRIEALNFWAFVAAERGERLALAEKRAQVALAFTPGSAAILDTVGWIHFQQGRFATAAPFLRGAAAIEPEEPEIVAHVAMLEAKQGAIEPARARARQALALGPEPKLKAQLEALLASLPHGRSGGPGKGPHEARSDAGAGKPR